MISPRQGEQGIEPQSRGISTSPPVLLKLWLTSGNWLMHSKSSRCGKELSRKKSDLIWHPTSSKSLIPVWDICKTSCPLKILSRWIGNRSEIKIGNSIKAARNTQDSPLQIGVFYQLHQCGAYPKWGILTQTRRSTTVDFTLLLHLWLQYGSLMLHMPPRILLHAFFSFLTDLVFEHWKINNAVSNWISKCSSVCWGSCQHMQATDLSCCKDQQSR